MDGWASFMQGDPLAVDLFQQAQQDDAWEGLQAILDAGQRSGGPQARNARAAYLRTLGPYLHGDVVNPRLQEYACVNSVSVVGSSELSERADDELARFRTRGFPFASLSDVVGRYRKVYADTFVTCGQASELVDQVNRTFHTGAFVENGFLGICAGCPSLPQSLVRAAPAAQLLRTGATIGILAPYKIGIYFIENDPGLDARAKELEASLRRMGLRGQVVRYAKSRKVLEYLLPADSDQIRYDAPAEEEASDALLLLLTRAEPGRLYLKLPTGGLTRNFLSVFFALPRPDAAR
jgi:hypothetical protein